jgi:DnaJ like chaperone protein
MGAVAKADGQVSPDEIALAENIMDEMDLTPDKRQLAIRLFNEGKASDFPLEEAIDQFRSECHRRSNLLRLFLEIQIQAAFADGELHPAESELLLDICRHLGFSEFIFRQLLLRIQGEPGFHQPSQGPRPGQAQPSLADAYQVLGIEESATDAEIKKTYRRLMNQHHPDKMVAKGLPEEMMKLAQQKTIEIRQAYDQIKAARGMR